MNMYNLKELKIEVTYKCPLACVHCSSEANDTNELNLDKIKCMSIIKEAIDLGIKELAISGGEPMYWEGLSDVIKYAASNGLVTSIYTSGNHENYKHVISELAMNGLKRAVFSIYSADKIEHNRVTRKKTSFDNTINSIVYSKSVGIIPEIHFVALASNYTKLESICKFAHDIGVKRISVLRFVPQGRGVLIQEKDSLSQEQNQELRKLIVELREKGFDIRTGSPFNVLYLNEKPKCLAAQDRLIIAPDLRLYPCDAFKQIRYEEFDVNDKYSALNNVSLKDCWEKSSYLNRIREAIYEENSAPCKFCNAFDKCKSGCLAQKYILYKSLSENPDPACLMRKVKQ